MIQLVNHLNHYWSMIASPFLYYFRVECAPENVGAQQLGSRLFAQRQRRPTRPRRPTPCAMRRPRPTWPFPLCCVPWGSASASTSPVSTIHTHFVDIHCIFQLWGALDVVLRGNSPRTPTSASPCNFANPGKTWDRIVSVIGASSEPFVHLFCPAPWQAQLIYSVAACWQEHGACRAQLLPWHSPTLGCQCNWLHEGHTHSIQSASKYMQNQLLQHNSWICSHLM
jgi:hypothetical protein